MYENIRSAATIAAFACAVFGGCTDFGEEPLSTVPAPSPPLVVQVVPDSGRVGDTLAASGARFGDAQGASELRIGGLVAPVLAWSDTLIAATVPLGSPGGLVTVVVDGRESNGLAFAVLATADIVLASLVPDSAAAGDTVRVAGSGFGETQGAGEVRFGLLSAPVAAWSDTLVVVTVPAGAVTGEVRVLAGGGQSNPLLFRLPAPPLPLPVLADLIPHRTVPGDTVRIAGSQFGSEQFGRSVVFAGASPVLDGDLEATVIGWSDAEVMVLVPAGAVSGPVAVVNGDERTNELAFDVAPAVVVYSQVDAILARPSPSGSCKDCHGGSGGFHCRMLSQILTTGLHAPVVKTRRSEESHLMCRLRGTACGWQMPDGGPPMAAADIQTIADWIDQGLRP